MNGCHVLLLALLLLWSGIARASWEQIGPEGGDVRHVIQSQSDPNDLWAFSHSGPTIVLRSLDGGSSWAVAGSFDNLEHCAAVSPNGTLYAGGESAFMFSTDMGVSWTSILTGSIYWYGVAVSPDDPDIVFGTGYRSEGSTCIMCFMKSTDGGSSWTCSSVGAPNSYGQAMAVSETDPSVMFISGRCTVGGVSEPAVFRSTDGGGSWTDVTPAAASAEANSYSVAVSPVDGNLVIFGTHFNIYRSTDCGSTWTRVTDFQYYNYSIAFSPADPGTVFAGGYGSAYRSTDAGVTWSSYSSGLPAQHLYSVTPHRTDVTKVYTGTLVGFWRSTSGGTSWSAANTGLYIGSVCAVGVSPTQPSELVMQVHDTGIWLTTDDGSNWTHPATPLTCGDFCSMAFSPAGSSTILALAGSG